MNTFCDGREDCEGGWCAYCKNGHYSSVTLNECPSCGSTKEQGDPEGHYQL